MGPASDGHQMGLVMARQWGANEAPLPGVRGGLGTRRECPGSHPKAAEPPHEQQLAAGEGRRLPGAGSAPRKPPRGALAWGKAPVVSVIVSRHFQNEIPLEQGLCFHSELRVMKRVPLL